MVVMDWLGKLIRLPEDFLFGGKGGGVIQVSITNHIISGDNADKVAYDTNALCQIGRSVCLSFGLFDI